MVDSALVAYYFPNFPISAAKPCTPHAKPEGQEVCGDRGPDLLRPGDRAVL